MNGPKLASLAPATPAPQIPGAAEREVLVVDDVPEICDFFAGLARRLRAPRVRIATEVRSDRAVALVSARRFDLVVSDYRMRQVDGVEVLRAARAFHPEGLRLLMTGYNEIPAPLSRICEARVDGYLQKPLRAQDTLLLLVAFLNRDASTLAAHRAHARGLEQAALREERRDQGLA